MANVKISELPAITVPTDADLLPVVQSSVTDKITRANFLTGVYRSGGTDVAVADGGTGASDAATARSNLGLIIGTNVQAYDATLAAIAAYNTNGILTQTAADTFTGRTITGTSNKITVTNGDGVAGNPTITVPASAQLDIAKITNLTTNGFIKTASSDGTISVATASANSKLLGSGDSGSGSPYSEITIGSGLTMTGTTLSSTATGGGTETRRIPVQIRSPQTASNAGNAFFNIQALTNQDFGCWEFVKDVSGNVFGVVSVPPEADASPAAKIILIIAANATSGVTSLNVSTKCVADDGESANVSFTADTEQDITVPGTAYLTKKVTFSAGDLTNAAPNDLIFVKILHHGDAANDTLAVNTLLIEAYLEVNVTPA